MSLFHEVSGHVGAHVAEADEADPTQRPGFGGERSAKDGGGGGGGGGGGDGLK